MAFAVPRCPRSVCIRVTVISPKAFHVYRVFLSSLSSCYAPLPLIASVVVWQIQQNLKTYSVEMTMFQSIDSPARQRPLTYGSNSSAIK